MLGFSLTYYYFLVFPIALLGFSALRRYGQSIQFTFVTLTSLLFLALADFRSLLLLVTLVFANYHLHEYLRSGKQRKIALRLGIVYNLLPLVLLKVTPGLLGDIAPKSLSFNVLLPLGLAFYALQQITALVDIYKNPSLRMSFSAYCFYSCFFLTIVSGPIFRYQDAISQYQTRLTKRKRRYFTTKGLSLFIVGLAKFALLASPITQHLNVFFTGLTNIEGLQLTFTEGLYIIIGCLVSLYFSFSAFSDMAIGLALCFGIQLPVNFDSPLKAKTPTQYINTWHMSFIAFVRIYVFQPVFRAGKRLPIVQMEPRIMLAWSMAVFCSFFITGAWHAPTTFMMWQSALVALLIVLTQLGLSSSATSKYRFVFSGFISQGLTRLVIFTTALFFFSPTLDIAVHIVNSVITPSIISLSGTFSVLADPTSSQLLTFNGFFPNYSGFPQTWKAHLYLPTAGLSLIHLVVALGIAMSMPNTMHIFGLIHSRYASLIEFKWRLSGMQILILSVLLYLSIDALEHGQAFTYG